MEEGALKRVMPHSNEAEQSVLGAMLLDNETIPVVENILSGEDFYQRQYGVIFDAIVEIYEEGRLVDLITLQSKLQEKDLPPEVTNLTYIGDVLAIVPAASNAASYAEIVKEKSTLRKIIRVNEEIANACYAGKDSTEHIMEKTEADIFKVLNQRKTSDFVPIKEVTLNALAKINKASRTKNPVTGIPTGFTDLDYRLAGLQNSDMILIAARPSMGKTAFTLNIAQNVALKQDRCVAIFSLEMSKEQLINRMFAMESHIDAQAIRTGNLTDGDWDNLVEAVDLIGNSKLIIDDTPGITIGELRTKCRQYKLQYGLELVMIDYLQLMNVGGNRRSDNRQQEITEISRSLKAIARELNCPVIALSQLSRAPEQRPDHRPMLSDLRESGSIEQDADVVMFLYRDDYYNKDTAQKNVAEVIVAKQRNGPVGTVELAWLPQYTKFANLKKS